MSPVSDCPTPAGDDLESIRATVRDAFERVRETPGADYDPKRLIHYLIDQTTKKSDVHNSFKGKRHFLKFIRTLQDRFVICFSNKDLDSLKSLDKFTERIAYLQATPKSSLSTLSYRVNGGFDIVIALGLAIISAPIVAICCKIFSFYGLIALVLPLWLIGMLVRSHFRNRAYHRDLDARIRALVKAD